MTPKLNSKLALMSEYASKAISQKAKNISGVNNLSIGEPAFGPPEDIVPGLIQLLSDKDTFFDAVNRYEESRGSIELREAIAKWYYDRYRLEVNPKTELLITHGGVEAIAQSILACTENTGAIALTDPSYMLYERSVITLGRDPEILTRPVGEHEYLGLFSIAENQNKLKNCDALIINSPENPTGYMLSEEDWQALEENAVKHNLWIIHDEVYDTMSFARKHLPARSIHGIASRSIMVNSFSKKFGVPGLRIGWVLANENIIDLICKSHDYLYLGVNILFEKLALELLNYNGLEAWFSDLSEMISDRMNIGIQTLNKENGFEWPRKPMGGMFLFPKVKSLYDSIPNHHKSGTVGEAVCDYLLTSCNVSTVPGIVYGAHSADHIRLVLCSDQQTFDNSLKALITAQKEP